MDIQEALGELTDALRCDWAQLQNSLTETLVLHANRQQQLVLQCSQVLSQLPVDRCGGAPALALGVAEGRTKGNSLMERAACTPSSPTRPWMKQAPQPQTEDHVVADAISDIGDSGLQVQTSTAVLKLGANETCSAVTLPGRTVRRSGARYRRGNSRERMPASMSSVSMPLHRRFLESFSNWMDWWLSLQEPPREGALARFVDGRVFENICAIVIIINGAFAVYATNYAFDHLDDASSPFIAACEVFFLVFYALELVLKLLVHRVYFFCNGDMRWNIFDFALVSFALYSQLLTTSLDVTYMRSLRIVKMAKILRVVRVMRFFSELRLILNSLLGSLMSLCWSIVMLALIFYIFGLIFVQGSASYLADMGAEVSDTSRRDIDEYFGSVQVAMMTLYKVSTGGDDWSLFYNIIKVTGAINTIFFLFFVAFIHIALLNILTGIFVENAMKLAQPDFDIQAQEYYKRELAEADTLRRTCQELVGWKRSMITVEDLVDAMDGWRMRSQLSVLGLQIEDAELFFEMCTESRENTTREISIDEFVEECMRMRGHATRVDVQSLVVESRIIQRSQQHVADHLTMLSDTLNQQVKAQFMKGPQVSVNI